MALIRLDKLISQSGERTRSEAAKLIRAGVVSIDGIPAYDPAKKVDATVQAIMVNGSRQYDQPYQYILFHKPAGVLTAANDRHAETVMNLLPKSLWMRKVMPVGRLDKDTTGLLLLTNHGELAHQLLSPKKHVWKEYRAVVDGLLRQADIEAFERGVALKEFTAKKAYLEILNASQEQSTAVVRLREGKYHQVKRVFSALGLTVVSLHRSAFGPLRLDIEAGEYRELSIQEIQELQDAVRQDGEENV